LSLIHSSSRIHRSPLTHSPSVKKRAFVVVVVHARRRDKDDGTGHRRRRKGGDANTNAKDAGNVFQTATRETETGYQIHGFGEL
jgi:hypothetical protein|tara:strand:+ start:173 stop:424 length:252 start_codon:yes stop_codon:yes gene_type:complete